MSRTFKSIIFILLFTVFHQAYSQHRVSDSLNIVLTNPKLHDTTRLRIIHDVLATRFTNNYDPDFHRINDMLGTLALKNYKSNNNPKLQKRYTLWLASYYSNLASRYSQEEAYNKSVAYFDKAIAIYRSIKAYDDMYGVYLTKSQLYILINQYDKAITMIFEALKYFEKDKKANVYALTYVYTMLAHTYREQNEYEKSIRYSLEADRYSDLTYKQYPGNSALNFKAAANGNISYCYCQLKRYKEALPYCLKSLDLWRKIGAKTQLGLSLLGAADIQMKLSNFVEAEKLYQEILNLKSSADDAMTMATVYFGLGTLNYNKDALADANKYGEKAFEISKKSGNKTLQKDIATLLYQINLKNKNYEKALQFYEFDKKIADSTQIASSKKQISEQQLKYEFEKKELQQKIIQQKKLAALRLESEMATAFEASKNKQLKYDFERKVLQQKIMEGKKVSAIKLQGEKKAAAIKLEGEKQTAQRNNWLIGLSGMLLLLLLGGFFYYRNNKQRQSIATLEKNQIKQKLLITQMNPHFIFNSIENIRYLIDARQNDEAVNYLGKFSKLTRQILENSNENYIALDEEVDMIENYLSIQQLLYNNKFNYSIRVEEGIDIESIFLPPMLTQPFIENAIKHGLSNTAVNGMIDIRFYLKDAKLFFEVTDNGKGFDNTQKISNHKSLAMTITKERLVVYTKNQDFIVQTDNIKGVDNNIIGAKVIFEIPYIYEN